MGGPQIPFVEVDGVASRGLGERVVAEFLVREAAAGEQRPPAREVAAPLRQRLLGLTGHGARPPEPEGVEMVQAQREDVRGMLVEDLLPGADRAIEVAADPGTEGAGVRLLPIAGAVEQAFGGAHGFDRSRHERLLVAQHRQVALEHVTEREAGIGGERLEEIGGDIAAVAEVAQHRVVERIGRRGTGCREVQAMKVGVGHTTAPSAVGSRKIRSARRLRPIDLSVCRVRARGWRSKFGQAAGKLANER